MDLKDFCRCERIELMHYTVKQVKYDIAFTSNTVTEILLLLINPKNFPLYIHCNDGTHIIGLIIMCLRKLQGWSYDSCKNEYLRYCQSRKIEDYESHFVKSYTGPIEIKGEYPSWLADSNISLIARSVIVIIPDALPNTFSTLDRSDTLSNDESMTLKALTLLDKK